MPKKNNPGCRCCSGVPAFPLIRFIFRVLDMFTGTQISCSNCDGGQVAEFYQADVSGGWTGQSPSDPDDCTDDECAGLEGTYIIGPMSSGGTCTATVEYDPVECTGHPNDATNADYFKATLILPKSGSNDGFRLTLHSNNVFSNGSRTRFVDGTADGAKPDCFAHDIQMTWFNDWVRGGGYCSGRNVTATLNPVA